MIDILQPLWFCLLLLSIIFIVASTPDGRTNATEFDTYLEFEQNLVSFEKSVIENNNMTLTNFIGLAILYNTKDDMWKLGGYRQSLNYTNLSLQILSSDSFLAQNKDLLLHVKYGLNMFQARIMINIGMYKEAIQLLDELYFEQKGMKGTIAGFTMEQKLSTILLTKADALLPKGKDAYEELEAICEEAIRLYPCQCRAFHRLATIYAIHFQKQFGVKQLSYLNISDSAFVEKIEDFYDFTSQVIANVHISQPTTTATLEENRNIVFYNRTSKQEVCSFQSDHIGLDIIVPYSHFAEKWYASNDHPPSDDDDESNTSSNEEIESEKVPDGVDEYAVLLAKQQSRLQEKMHTMQSILATYYGALFQIEQDVFEDYDTAWYSLQQARYYEQYRVEASAETWFVQYNHTAIEEKVQHISTVFHNDYWPQQPTQWLGHASKFPIFIVGFFRSGSTLLESLLDAHPYIWGMGENSPLGFHVNALDGELKQFGQYHKYAVQQVTKEYKQSKPDVYAQKMKLIHAARKKAHKGLLQKYGDTVIEKMKEYHRENTNTTTIEQEHSQCDAEETCSAATQSLSHNIEHIVDKLLSNYQNIGFIHLLFPNAIILHTVRDPLDCLLSCMRIRFDDFSVYTLRNSLLTENYLAYLKIMNHFRKSLPMLTFPNGQKRKALIDIRYEELVANPKKVMKEIFTLLDIPDVDDLSSFSSSSSSSSSSLSATKKQLTKKKKKEKKNSERKVDTDPNEMKEEREQQESSPLVGHSSSPHHPSSTSTSSTNTTSSHHDNSSSTSSSWIDHFHEQPRLVRTASYLQVKEPIYLKAIGSWKKYSKQLQETIIPALAGPLKRMSVQNMLPFDTNNHRVPMNWKLDKDFDYQGMIQKLLPP